MKDGLFWGDRADLDSTPAPSRACIFFCDLAADPWLALQTLAPTQDDRRDEGRAAAGRRDYFLRRRAVLRSIVGWRFGMDPGAVRIAYDVEGAPRCLTTPRCFASVAARGSLAAFAVGSTPIGIDLEPVDIEGRDRAALDSAAGVAWSVLAQSEERLLRALPPAERYAAFVRIWTMKEAYLKAAGVGFVRDPRTVAIVQTHDDRAAVSDQRGPVAGVAEWRFMQNGAVAIACFAAAADSRKGFPELP